MTDQNKTSVLDWSHAQYDFDLKLLCRLAETHFADDANVQLGHPFETLGSAQNWIDEALVPLQKAMPDLERRNQIVLSGKPENGSEWVGAFGYYTGSFVAPFLDIPPSGHQAAMRYHEFYRFEGGKIVEVQALWDLPELMVQSNSWPMAASLGREWLAPSPASQDGLRIEGDGSAALKVVHDMAVGLGKFAEGGVEAMELEKFWHPKFSWYGPAGIGTGRGLRGFRNWHQIPFLNGMPDRVGSTGKGNLFAEGDYVGFTAWPGMHMTISQDGFLGIPPVGKKITMRSLDFWRCEGSLIRENWVLVDLLHVYNQIGVDVLARMRELNKARFGMKDFIA